MLTQINTYMYINHYVHNHSLSLTHTPGMLYANRIVDEIVSSTFSLLSLSYSTPTLLGPAHFLALLDPKASWFRKWMVCVYTCRLSTLVAYHRGNLRISREYRDFLRLLDTIYWRLLRITTAGLLYIYPSLLSMGNTAEPRCYVRSRRDQHL